MKETTKDVDLVLTGEGEISSFRSALQSKATEYKLQKKIGSILYDLKPILKRRN